MSSGRIVAALAVVGVLVALAFFGARGRSSQPESSPASSPTDRTASSPPAEEEGEPDSPVGPPSARRVAAPATADDEDLPPQVRRFLEDNVYPPTSRPLERGAKDLLEPNSRYEKPRPLDEDGDILFVFTADRYYYAGDEVAQIWLEVVKGGQPAAVRIHRATAQAETKGRPDGPLVDLGLAPDGIRWASALDLEASFPDHHGTILLQVAFQADDGEVHGEAIRIFTTPLDRVPAEFTGDFRDKIHEGSLLVETGVDVFEPGFFRFDANLYDKSGEPVAFAVFKGELAPGQQFIPLEFFGKVIRDQGAEGPYTIDQIRGYRFLEAQTPDREQLVDVGVSHRTVAYEPSLFSDDEYTSPHKQRMIELMLEDVDEGRELDTPVVVGRSR